MPFTPFHFGPAATIALCARKYLDIPAFILVNIIIDIEPLIVMLFKLRYPTHGYLHTFLFGALTATLFALLLYSLRKHLTRITQIISLHYEPVFIKMLVSSILGAWLHVILDACIYSDIRPFYPFLLNPLYGTIGYLTLYVLCALFYIPAFFFYYLVKTKELR